MTDLIKRQDALTEIRKDGKWLEEQGVTSMTTHERELRDTFILRELPSAQQWIPCSEKLPDQNGKYLVVGRQKAINILKFDGGRWYGKWGVVAWMPLPETYREETES